MRSKTGLAIAIGALFLVVGVIYGASGWGTPGKDAAGATMLIVLGIAMTFAFGIILRGTRDL
ncbi:MAG: hypothetical protein ACHQ15_06290 [Candidatus Limnocylindrales bacterium]